jgi:hypothetical protein
MAEQNPRLGNPLVPIRYEGMTFGSGMAHDAAMALVDLGDAAMKVGEFRDAEDAYDKAASLESMAMRHIPAGFPVTKKVIRESRNAILAKKMDAIDKDEARRVT